MAAGWGGDERERKRGKGERERKREKERERERKRAVARAIALFRWRGRVGCQGEAGEEAGGEPARRGAASRARARAARVRSTCAQSGSAAAAAAQEERQGKGAEARAGKERCASGLYRGRQGRERRDVRPVCTEARAGKERCASGLYRGGRGGTPRRARRALPGRSSSPRSSRGARTSALAPRRPALPPPDARAACLRRAVGGGGRVLARVRGAARGGAGRGRRDHAVDKRSDVEHRAVAPCRALERQLRRAAPRRAARERGGEAHMADGGAAVRAHARRGVGRGRVRGRPGRGRGWRHGTRRPLWR